MHTLSVCRYLFDESVSMAPYRIFSLCLNSSFPQCQNFVAIFEIFFRRSAFFGWYPAVIFILPLLHQQDPAPAQEYVLHYLRVTQIKLGPSKKNTAQ